MSIAKALDECLDRMMLEGDRLKVRTGRPGPGDPLGPTTAFTGAAETGTLMLTSDAGHPTSRAILLETAIVVLPCDRATRAYEDALHAFHESGNLLPRSINLITDPARLGDIQQTWQLGAHGPKRLLIILLNEASKKESIANVNMRADSR